MVDTVQYRPAKGVTLEDNSNLNSVQTYKEGNMSVHKLRYMYCDGRERA